MWEATFPRVPCATAGFQPFRGSGHPGLGEDRARGPLGGRGLKAAVFEAADEQRCRFRINRAVAEEGYLGGDIRRGLATSRCWNEPLPPHQGPFRPRRAASAARRDSPSTSGPKAQHSSAWGDVGLKARLNPRYPGPHTIRSAVSATDIGGSIP